VTVFDLKNETKQNKTKKQTNKQNKKNKKITPSGFILK
jgi:hypothetical protein